ncbi:MAG: RNA polymerase factor sigma-54 [Pseudomonadota bacterium]
MALSAKLELKHGQQLVMTPQLQQAIKLLQLSNIELTAFVETELERNPLLEREDEAASGEPTTAARDGDKGEPTVAEPTSATSNTSDVEATNASDDGEWLNMEKSDGDATAPMDTEYENLYPDTSAGDFASDLAGSNWSSVSGGRTDFSNDDSNLEAYIASDLSLKDHISAQVPLVLTTPPERLIGQYLVDLLDDAGYLQTDTESIAERLGASEEAVEAVLAKLQMMDPPGVFARSLSECLAIQLREQNRYDPQIGALLDNLHLLAAHDLPKLRRAVGCDTEELTDMIMEIKGLNPKPGLQFGSVPIQPVVPDVLVRAARDGSWLVELNSETLPRVLVNRTYFTKVSVTTKDTDEREYLTDCLQNANWLVKSLDQRARTILRVAEEIIRQQDGFLTHGVQYLRPMNLKTVAEAISMHESTVSRVTSNKYMATSRGIFELKYFFTSSISSSEDGEAHSSESVRYRIKQLIDAECAAAVLSDDKIVDMLKGDGIDIARRTVAKYREAMRIPSSVQRRREKRMSEQMERTA